MPGQGDEDQEMADESGAPAGDSRAERWLGDATPLVLRWSSRVFILVSLYAIALFAGTVAVVLLSGDGVNSYQNDFNAFWTAARLTVEGRPHLAYDVQTILDEQVTAVKQIPGDDWRPWLYPPNFQLLVIPLGLLPYVTAFTLFTALGFFLYARGLMRWTDPLPGAATLALASPLSAYLAFVGNTSLIWAGLLLLALHALSEGRRREAGMLIGLLTIKPQLGLLIPVALIATGAWRTIAWATLGSIALVAASLLALGPAVWKGFLYMARLMSEEILKSPAYADTMVTWYALAIRRGVDHDAALVVQAGATVTAGLAVAWLWRREEPSFFAYAGLLFGILVATPYAFQYELALAIGGTALLARAGIGQTPWGLAWLAAIWASPLPGWWIPGIEIADYMAVFLTLSLGLCVLLERTARRSAVALA